MQHNSRQPWVLAVLCLVLSSVLMFANAQTTAYSRSDISGNDIDCGQTGGKCRICGDISSIEASCRANPSCAAFTFDNSCGFLKTAGDPKTYREGFTTFLLAGKTPGAAAAPAAAAPAPAVATNPAPAAANANANPAAGNTVQVAAPAAAAPAAAAAGGACSLNAWDQCGGQGNACSGPGKACADAPFPGCTCPGDNPCQKRDSFYYQCAPPGHFAGTAPSTSTGGTPAAAPAPAPSDTIQVSAPPTTSAPAPQQQTASTPTGGGSSGGGGVFPFGFGPGGAALFGGRRLLLG